MNYFVYVLKSRKNGLKYIGFTLNVGNRLKEHNMGRNVSTRNKGPWELIYFEEYSTRLLAQKRERFLKSGHGKSILKNIIGT